MYLHQDRDVDDTELTLLSMERWCKLGKRQGAAVLQRAVKRLAWIRAVRYEKGGHCDAHAIGNRVCTRACRVNVGRAPTQIAFRMPQMRKCRINWANHAVCVSHGLLLTERTSLSMVRLCTLIFETMWHWLVRWNLDRFILTRHTKSELYDQIWEMRGV